MRTKPVLLFFIVFSIYLFTLHPTVPAYRDSGDLVVASSTVGLAHPPGYPLYILCGKVFDMLSPFGNTAYHVNIMSAVFGAGAAFVLAVCLESVFGGSWWILISLFLLLFSPSYWRLAQVPEMYSLNAFLLSLILLLAIKLSIDFKAHNINNPLFLLIAFLCGIASGNHQTIIFIIPGLAWFFWSLGSFKIEDIAYGILLFSLGLSVYLFLPLRFSTAPVSSWGEPQSIEGLFRIITRSDYGGMKLHPEQSKFEWSFGMVMQHLLVYIKSLSQQFTWPGMLLGLIGIYLKIKDRFFKFLLISLLISGPVFVILSNLPPNEETTLPILEPHFVMPNVLFMFFVAACVSAIASKGLGKMLILFLAVLSFNTNMAQCDYRNSFFAYDYARNLFLTLKQGSFIYNPDDSTAFLTTYFQKILKKRQDIKLIAYYRTRWGYMLMKERYPEILPKEEVSSGRELEHLILDYNREKFRIFSELPSKFPPNYSSYPYGCLFRMSEKGEYEPDNSPFIFYVERGAYSKSEKNDFFTNHIISYYSSSHNNLGLAFANIKQYDTAQKEYYKSLSIDRTLIAAYNNLGTLEYAQSNYEKAVYWFNRVLKYNTNSDLVLFNIGLTYKALQKYQQAQEAFLKLWQKGNSANVGNELGLLYLYSGETNRSIEFFTKAIELDPKYLYAYYNLGLAYQKAGDYPKSKLSFKYYQGLVQDPKEKQEVEKILKTLQ
ncbi:MAG: DUF2723 domain-containing protein [Elusimicrobia bacterium]|nr:DUF2723 domain-containing protein [Candidatus Liberimonas magnetica]